MFHSGHESSFYTVNQSKCFEQHISGLLTHSRADPRDNWNDCVLEVTYSENVSTFEISVGNCIPRFVYFVYGAISTIHLPVPYLRWPFRSVENLFFSTMNVSLKICITEVSCAPVRCVIIDQIKKCHFSAKCTKATNLPRFMNLSLSRMENYIMNC